MRVYKLKARPRDKLSLTSSPTERRDHLASSTATSSARPPDHLELHRIVLNGWLLLFKILYGGAGKDGTASDT
jgi:hypothetical protein